MTSLVLAVVALLAAAPPAGERLARAKICAEEVDLDCAEAELDAVFAAEATLGPTDRRAAWRLRAEVHLARGREDGAIRAFQALLRLEPEFEPGDAAYPPAWRDVLAKARSTMEDVFRPVVRHTPPRSAEDGQPLVLTAEVRDAGGMGTVVAAVVGGPDVSLSTSDGVRWTGVVPATAVRAPALRYVLIAVDRAGNGPVRSGPHEVPVDDARPVTRNPWFWVSVGVGTAGVIALVTALVLTADDGSEPSHAPRGGITLTVDLQGLTP